MGPHLCRLVREWTGHTRAVRALAVSPDGSIVVSGSDDTTLLVWNTQPK
ncbi:MAG: WD40 repeat domain-containing protein [Candidatus Latescibacteria bacterium]|nr:WD40 repeat domain-containing protein [Candidatus Latescibacterota bacterium]